MEFCERARLVEHLFQAGVELLARVVVVACHIRVALQARCDGAGHIFLDRYGKIELAVPGDIGDPEAALAEHSAQQKPPVRADPRSGRKIQHRFRRRTVHIAAFRAQVELLVVFPHTAQTSAHKSSLLSVPIAFYYRLFRQDLSRKIGCRSASENQMRKNTVFAFLCALSAAGKRNQKTVVFFSATWYYMDVFREQGVIYF